MIGWGDGFALGEQQICSGCCRSPPALELTVSDTLQSFGLALGGATSGRLQGYC